MALVNFREDHLMDASAAPIADAPWLSQSVVAMLNYVGLGGISVALGFVWRVSARVTRIDVAAKGQEKINVEVKARLDGLDIKDTQLEVALARLPDREELRDMFREVREDIRGAKARRDVPR